MPRVSPPERLRRLCLALPETIEVEQWGGPTYRVRKKIFAMQPGAADGAPAQVWVKAERGVQGMLVAEDPGSFFAPPYLGPKGWVGAWLGGGTDWERLAELVEVSFRLVAPNVVLRQLD